MQGSPKSFIAKVRDRRITLGAYPTVPLHDARKKALALKADSSPGQPALPFAEARTTFLKFKKKHLLPSPGTSAGRKRWKSRTTMLPATRSRLLTDEELKAVWRAAGQTEGHFGSDTSDQS